MPASIARPALIALALLFAPVHAALADSARPGAAEQARWQRHAAATTIERDDWGIAHVHGRTDADAVFGMVYAQAEDDFNRVETNYINAMGRLAEAEGESAIWQDLRMKLFIDPAELQRLYGKSPRWLQALMDAWADPTRCRAAGDRPGRPSDRPAPSSRRACPRARRATGPPSDRAR